MENERQNGIILKDLALLGNLFCLVKSMALDVGVHVLH